MVLTLASLFSTVSWYLMQLGSSSGGTGYGARDGDDRNNSAGAMIIIIAVVMLAWVISFLIICAMSCYREFAAGAAQMAGKPEKLANALMRISGSVRRVTTKDLCHVKGLNVFLSSPQYRVTTGNLFCIHPPFEKRIQKLIVREASMS